MSLDLLRRVQAWSEGELSSGATQVLLSELLAARMWLPGARQPAAGTSGHAVQRLHFLPGDPGELPTLPVWLEDPAALSPPVTVPTLLQNGAALLAFAMSQRFNAVLASGDERCLLTCDDLLSLRALMLLDRVARGEPVERPAAPDVSRLLPALLAHCASEPAIERAWLALIHSAASTQAAVMLQAPRAEWHQAALARRLDPLLPPGVSLTVIDAQGDFNPPLRRAIAAHPPVHDTAVRPGWFERVRRRFAAAPVPVIEVDLHA